MAEPSAADADDEEPVILTDVTDRVGTITMNRPARRNALNGELIGALDDAVRQMADDPDAKVIVLTGAAPEGGHGGFCSGGDVKGGGRGSPGSEKGVPAGRALRRPLPPRPPRGHAAAPDAQADHRHGGWAGRRRGLQPRRRLRSPLRLRGRRVLRQLLAQRAVRRLRGLLLLDPHRRDRLWPGASTC